VTLDHAKFHEEIQATAIFEPDYADDVLARLAYNSSAIEGNTLTLADTITLLVDERTPRAGTPVRELYEVSNHRGAITRILRAVADAEPLTAQLVTELHGLLMDHLAHDHGQYKTSSNRITGASWRPAEPSQVPQLMQQWVDQTEWQTANLDGPPLLEAIAQSHIAFERIHPFSDGNGRTGRAVIAYQTVRKYGFPAIVRVDQRSSYITMLDAEDVPGLATLLATNLAAEADRYGLAAAPSDA
jgi:Fic family protein